MPKPRRKPTAISMMRNKAVLGGVALVIAIGFAGTLIAFDKPVQSDPEVEETEETLPGGLTEAESEALRGPSTCRKPPGSGERIHMLDDPDDLEIVSGNPQVSAVQRTPKATALRVDIAQQEEEAILRARLDEPLDATEGRLGLWISQNGNLISPPMQWFIRLRTGNQDQYFERVFTTKTVRDAAGSWCYDVTSIDDWTPVGSPDATKITALELTVPAYLGAGAGNNASFDGFTLLPA